jgi:hypothetical protein
MLLLLPSEGDNKASRRARGLFLQTALDRPLVPGNKMESGKIYILVRLLVPKNMKHLYTDNLCSSLPCDDAVAVVPISLQ